jgi:hypothetical protein
MLMKIDDMLYEIPSKTINLVTLGKKGESLCARLYKYRFIEDRESVIVNSLIYIIDSIEKSHCKKAYIVFLRRRSK